MVFFLGQVTLQELCGSELRKEGSAFPMNGSLHGSVGTPL